MSRGSQFVLMTRIGSSGSMFASSFISDSYLVSFLLIMRASFWLVS